MCGINMILDFTGRAQAEHIQQMMDATAHRGPDDSRFLEKPFGKGRVYLGSNRLKIIDNNDASNQPFVSKDNRYALVYNGEVYNFENLRNQLLSIGVPFTSRSDTEVLLHWLIHKGKNGIDKLNGMFAFVFADFAERSLLIARDSLGIKPLFIHQSEGQIVISSEIKGIHASGFVPKKLNHEAIPHYLAYKYAPRPQTFFEDVQEFLPGCIWQIDAEGKTEKSSIPTKVLIEKPSIKQLLIDSIVQQYSQTNNTGVMLSGGVDSTLILAVLNKELGYRNIPVFSVATQEKQNKYATQDGAYAKKAAKLYQADYDEIGLNENSLNTLDDYIQSLGQPIADSGGFLTWLIAQKAAGKSKVLLSGAGADELFAGYNRHIAFYNYLKHRNKNWFSLLKQGGALPSFSLFVSQFKKFANSIEEDPSSTFNNFIQSDSFRIKRTLWENNLSNEAHVRNALTHDQTNYLGSDVLAVTDHGTMQYSIETRVPYLDKAIIEATKNLPPEDLTKKETKWMLKEQLINYGGKRFANRKKQGLGLPMDDWFRKNKQWFDFNEKDSLIHQFVDSNQIRMLVSQHHSRKENLTQDLWRILLLHRWLNYNFT
jgi:asparagine synthase (glutamine-hydrolysing)